MQQTRGEGPCGKDPTSVSGGERTGNAEPVTLVDLDGAVTRIAPFGSWTREQVRHPSGHPLFITRLMRGQLWHRASGGVSIWAHEVQVGPATVVSDAGRFHVVAEADGGATITCLEGEVAVATHLSEPLLLQPSQAVAVAADGETFVMVDLPPTTLGEATGAASLLNRSARGTAVARWFSRRTANAARPSVVAALLGLVAILLVAVIVLLSIGRG